MARQFLVRHASFFRCSLFVVSLLLSVLIDSSSSSSLKSRISAAVINAVDAADAAAQDAVRRKLSTYTLTFNCTNLVQEWIVPEGVATFSVDAYGAAGGDSTIPASYYDLGSTVSGGLGGYISVSNITARKGTTLYIYIGAAGGLNAAPGLGGGGGCAGSEGQCYSVSYTSGGGATDLRTNSSDLSSRLVVAGAGGGAGGQVDGGAGGGSTGQAGGAQYGFVGGGGGSQKAGGVGHSDPYDITITSTNGTLGQGGNCTYDSGGGGGGYYGGGGGVYGSGGGGGSSYADPTYTITNNKQGVRPGNGVLYITYTSCQAGYYLFGSSCLACAAGTFNPSPGSTSSCLACASKTYSAIGASICSSLCPSGTAAHGTSACLPPTLAFTFTTDNVQQWVVPANVATFTVDAYGAAGGDWQQSGGGGLGGYISLRNIAASSFVGQTLFIYVGAAGKYNEAPGLGGGGGCAGLYCHSGFYTSGGGATDLRTNINDLSSRLVVAGGGGGAGLFANGGAGGGLVGQAGGDYNSSTGFVGGGGGNQTAGGAGHTSISNAYTSFPGSFGQGGDILLFDGGFNGGGGGGYYGGGGGVLNTGGGGGSSYAKPSNTITNNTRGIRPGNGVLYITLICKDGHDSYSCACVAGTYYDASKQACIACPAGYFNPSFGQTSLLACQACAAGSVTDTLDLEGATSCTPCSAGTFSSSSTQACTSCSKGFFSSTCLSSSCAAGSTNKATGPRGGGTGCTQVSPGYCAFNGTSCVSIGAGSQSECPRGTFGVSRVSCEDCAAGTYQPSSAQTFCIACDVGKASSSIGNASTSTCQACQRGEFATVVSQPSCSLCIAGTYSTVVGATSSFVCQSCPTGKASSASGSSSCTSCLRGQYASSKASASCNFCSPGQWTATAGSSSCSSCPAGRYSSTIGATSCVPCPPGSFTAQNGSSSCVACPQPLIAASSGLSACSPCSPDTSYSGPTFCIDSTLSASTALNSITDGDGSFYLIAIMALLCAALAVLIDRVKKNDILSVVQINFYYGTLVQFALFGGSLVSEFYLAYGLLSAGHTPVVLGAVIYASRILHLLPTGLVVISVSTSTSSNASFKRFLDTIHFFQNAFPYSLLLLLCLVEAPLLQYLPWRISPLASVAGFPNLFLLRFAYAVKTFQNLIVLCCQFIVIASTRTSTSLSSVAHIFLYINVGFTLSVAALGLLEGYLKRSLLPGSQLSFEPTNLTKTHNDTPIGSSGERAGIEMRESTASNPLNARATTSGASVDGGSSHEIMIMQHQRRRDTIPEPYDDGTDAVTSARIWNDVQRKLQRLQSASELQGSKTGRLELKLEEALQALGARVDALESRPFLFASDPDSDPDREQQHHQQAV